MKTFLLSTLIAVVSIYIGATGYMLYAQQASPRAGAVGGNTSVTATASTTAFTLTTTSQRLLATSTKRVAYDISNGNCTGGGTAYVLDNKDAPAVARTGIQIIGSTTKSFTGYLTPPSNTAVTGIVDGGTCTVLVTEYRANF